MKIVTMLAKVDADKCNGCSTCAKVCPVLAIKIANRLSVIDADKCRGCGNCEQRCPEYAIVMEKRETPINVGVDVSAVSYENVEALCKLAKFHPEQLVCYCTATRAEEVAAAILLGAKTPEDISLVTGVRTGCKVECIQPMLRLLEVAGIVSVPPKGGWQWYGRTATIWDIPEDVKQKYNSRGFYFEEDIQLFEDVINADSKKGGDQDA